MAFTTCAQPSRPQAASLNVRCPSLYSATRLWWYVDAIRLRGVYVAREGVSAGTAAATDLSVLAIVAFAIEPVGIAQAAKDGRFLIHVDRRVQRKQTTNNRQKSAGMDQARVTDEHHSLAVIDAQRRAKS